MNNKEIIALTIEAAQNIMGRTIQPGDYGRIEDYVMARIKLQTTEASARKSFAQPLRHNREDAIIEDLHD